jgi:tRNA-2-methylthio-N6-dimethylallyladenosine synthase
MSRKLYIETYGCQMNVVDSEVVAAILQQQHYSLTDRAEDADLILVNTCSIREHAEQRVRARLKELKKIKDSRDSVSIGVIGCMAERLKDQLLEEEPLVDLVAGPDAYRQLPALLSEVEQGRKGIDTVLSARETYSDIAPLCRSCGDAIITVPTAWFRKRAGGNEAGIRRPSSGKRRLYLSGDTGS